MEKHGITIDKDRFQQLETKTAKEIKSLEKKFYKESGQTFNIASPKQLSEVLFRSMNLPMLRKIKTGSSTGSDVLNKLAPQYPICKHLIEYRELTKLQSTYIKALPQLARPETCKSTPVSNKLSLQQEDSQALILIYKTFLSALCEEKKFESLSSPLLEKFFIHRLQSN